MPYLYLVRHAQPDFAGHYDSVTRLGRQQSVWLGEHFEARGLRFARAYSGSLVRQADTLADLRKHMARTPEPVVDPRFNEYDAASVLAASGLGDERALRAHGDRRAYFTAVRAALQAWAARAEAPATGGESWDDFTSRVTTAAAEACRGLQPNDNVLVVTSGGVIGRLVAAAVGAGAEGAIQLNLQTRNTGVTELMVGRSAMRLVAFNGVPHLERADRAHALTYS